jgi:hypothetical protein
MTYFIFTSLYDLQHIFISYEIFNNFLNLKMGIFWEYSRMNIHQREHVCLCVSMETPYIQMLFASCH